MLIADSFDVVQGLLALMEEGVLETLQLVQTVPLLGAQQDLHVLMELDALEMLFKVLTVLLSDVLLDLPV